MGLFTCWCGKKIYVGEKELAAQGNKRITEHLNEHRAEERKEKERIKKEQDIKNQEWLRKEGLLDA